MTGHYTQDTPVASEEFSYWPVTGSNLFCNPSEVVHWQQNVTVAEASIPTPPESECPSLEALEMISQMSQCSLPEDSPIGSTSDNGHYFQPPGDQWQSSGLPVTTQGNAASSAATPWTASPISVGLGSSSGQSYECQSRDTLSSSEQDLFCVLPDTLDLSFATESVWNLPNPMIYRSPDLLHAGDCNFTTLPEQIPVSTGCSVAPAPVMFPGTQGPVFHPQVVPVSYQRRTDSHPPAVPRRTLLPRTEGSTVPSQSVYGQQQAESFQMQDSHGAQHTVSSVSSLPGQFRNGICREEVSGQSSGIVAGRPQYVSSGYSYPIQATIPGSSALMSYGLTGSTMQSSLVPEPINFNDFIDYAYEEPVGATDTLSLTPGYGLASPVSSSIPEEVKPMVASPHLDTRPSSQVPGGTLKPASENDEGRHRTHALYSEGPRADGLYHCPFKTDDPNCPHKPTKLKCNYDKFIDSHLKPFRCKIEACAKQEFSSTACLLRHEREAHGMHGHGEKPHLCRYPGCDRGTPGYGFPRRYNLFDHMKRVHDHKEDPADVTGSPVMGADSQKKGVSRKRKASASPPAPATQRQKPLPQGPQQSQVVYYPTPGYIAQSVYDAEPFQGHHVMPHLATQRALMAKQMHRR